MQHIEILQHKDSVLTERIRTGEGTAIQKPLKLPNTPVKSPITVSYPA